ncbi:hydroxyacylglutathione hydrolase [Shewanella sedimentimangrovi]|uniref:Hydroxyacylglutathione hydrolase n=1 Tax=Shewanella sedimentimangrovi TaxID=2814293 RepID=A0ABX7R7Q2_9GAMM|nr:hydroxyacylglutathione hydrolase [Shewanella sedimentimangrovi]QSX38798.1 hydroxyacylglutathione hydrolase [Shewanella sedimentimangrovi]
MLQVYPIPAFKDNYIWLLNRAGSSRAWVVDPGDAAPVIAELTARGLILEGILVTHHHWDHTGGIEALLDYASNTYGGHKIRVIGPRNPAIANVSERVSEGDSLHLGSLSEGDTAAAIKVLEVPGHTLDHIAFLIGNSLFCGDTLFSAGCGRLFEGTAAQLHESLAKLAALPGDTRVYCTHEYTEANLKFALTAEPENAALADYADWVKQQRSGGLPSLPSSLARELAINPFLRTGTDSIRAAVAHHSGIKPKDDVHTLALLRQWKDIF